MKMAMLFLLGSALLLLIGIVVLASAWAGGSRMVFLPGLGIAISTVLLLAILVFVETVLILLAVMIWRS